MDKLRKGKGKTVTGGNVGTTLKEEIGKVIEFLEGVEKTICNCTSDFLRGEIIGLLLARALVEEAVERAKAEEDSNCNVMPWVADIERDVEALKVARVAQDEINKQFGRWLRSVEDKCDMSSESTGVETSPKQATKQMLFNGRLAAHKDGFPPTYPYLAEAACGTIVLMVRPNTGMVLDPRADYLRNTGDYSTDWDETMFHPCSGPVTLENSPAPKEAIRFDGRLAKERAEALSTCRDNIGLWTKMEGQ